MHSKYSSLKFNSLDKPAALYKPSHMLEGAVSESDPALFVFTDFQRITPFNIEASASLERANDKMLQCGVRLLFVCDDGGNLEGLITADDILGERPVKYIQEHGGSFQDILVLDIMTHRNQLHAVTMSSVMEASVGDIVCTIAYSGKHHILVKEKVNGENIIRGLFSKTQVARQIAKPIKVSSRANSFADLELALVVDA